MTYDQWKTTPPEERWGVLTCGGCGGWMTSGDECCGDCAAERHADEAMTDFYQWEPTVINDWEKTPEEIAAINAALMERAMAPRKDPKHPMFRDHNCWRCRDGEKPCINKRGPHDCEYPHARND